MKAKYIHTTHGVRNPHPIQVITLTSESGEMSLTITLDELADYENRQLGHAGALDELYPVAIPDDCFGAILEDLREDQILEEEYVNQQ
jgi:hypothetical protein